MEGYDAVVHRTNGIIPGVALVGIILAVLAPGRSRAERRAMRWRHEQRMGQRMAIVGDVVERLEVHAG